MKSVLVALVAYFTCLVTCSAAALQASVANKTSSLDCIEHIISTNSGIQIRTRQGVELKIFNDEYHRPTIYNINGKVLEVIYDTKNPRVPRFVRDVQDGHDWPIDGSPIAKEIQNEKALTGRASRHFPSSPIARCNGGGTSGHPLSLDGDNSGGDIIVDLYEREQNFASPQWWAQELEPGYSEMLENWGFAENKQRQCIARKEDCDAHCDNWYDFNQIVACGVGTAALTEFPIAAGIYLTACSSANVADKNKCKEKCGSLTRCF